MDKLIRILTGLTLAALVVVGVTGLVVSVVTLVHVGLF